MINQEEILKNYQKKEKCEINAGEMLKYIFLTVSRLDPQKGFERIEIMLKELEKNHRL